ncbi:MAG: aldehyde dehydrogenase family protein [Chloroflexi bacterium]|nr:aldehyde dehydrogenase family protein [Chloroflexota bacterium]
MAGFKLTYATMYNPPEELHANFDASLAKLKANLGKEHAMIINGKDVFAEEKFEDRTPIDTSVVLAIMQKGNEKHAEQAMAAARKAFPGWSHTPWQERIRLLRKAADLIDERLTDLGVVMAMEVGKNRMESMGDVAETADLIRYSCDMMEQNDGFIKPMGKDPLPNHDVTNLSVLRPYGVWLVVSPFNFPFALTGGPAGAALAAGNTIVMKPATDTPFIVRLMAECFRDAGLPDGVANFVTGPGRTIGSALVNSPEVDGVTFTGSYDVGMKMFRDFANGKFVRPMVLELGGKNPAVVTKNANLDDAAQGIVRSAFGLQGQKCSAASRVYIQEEVYDGLTAKLKELTEKLAIGDPTDRKVFLGPVMNKSSYQDFQNFCADLGNSGKFLTGGKIITEGALEKGYYCAPTFAVDVPYSHHLWKEEMFLPITTIGKFKTLEEALVLANDVDYGLTAGVYGSEEETEYFFDKIEAGVTYANRPQGATTGAWPGFQPFGGWKGSGSSGKNAGGYHYVQLYMHEQIRTLVRPKK